MITPIKATALLLVTSTALAMAQNKEQDSKPSPAPEMQRVAKMLVGTWKVDEDFAPGDTLPNGGKGTGRSVIRSGPGGFSVIEDFDSSAPNLPDYHLHAVYWWDRTAHGLKVVDCDDLSEEICSIQDGVGRWEGNDVVTNLTIQKDGKAVSAKLVWTQKDSQSFAATMYVADSNGTLKRDWTFLHIRVK
jgi:hypothetical protein